MLSVFFVGLWGYALFGPPNTSMKRPLGGETAVGKGGAINQNAPETRAETRKEKDGFSNFQPSILLTAFFCFAVRFREGSL